MIRVTLYSVNVTVALDKKCATLKAKLQQRVTSDFKSNIKLMQLNLNMWKQTIILIARCLEEI